MWLEKITGDLAAKKQYLEYKKRVKNLPDGYRQAAAGLERYLLNLGPTSNGDSLISMLTDLADLLEQSAAAGTPIRDVVGPDPADFEEDFMQNYAGGSWLRTERQKLAATILEAEQQERPRA